MCKPNLTNIYHIEIELNSRWYKLYIIPADLFNFRLQIKMNENQPLDWLRNVWFIAGLQIRFLGEKNQHSAARERLWQRDGREEAVKYRSEKKNTLVGSNYL